MASLSWTDSSGAATLTNVMPLPVSHFAGWVPRTRVVGPREHALGTGIPYTYRFRTDYGAEFRLEHIAMEDADLAARLVVHLANAGQVTVTTTDIYSNVYTAYLAEGSEIDGALQMVEGDALIQYTLSLKLINASAAPMLCVYDVQPTRTGGSS